MMAASDPNDSTPMAKTKPAGPSPTQAGSNASDDELAATKIDGNNDELSETVVSSNTDADGQQITAPSPTKAASGGPPQEGGAAKPQARSGGKKKVSQLGDFKLLKKLGQGGMGTVYLATQVSLDRKVALKTLSKELANKPDLVQRFIREARSMARLQHPNIVQVYAADSKSGVHYAAIEYIDGQSMQDWMDQVKGLSVGDALHITLVCADALRHAHEQNMIHRDIKPDNILVTKKGVVKVADFGLAKALDEDVSMTQSGTGLGTPLYMAPEQARNAKHVDQRTDIYALGSTLYYFLTGKLPFTGETTLDLITAKEKGQFTPSRRTNRDVPERLDLMLDKMMAKDPQHRYSDCDEIIRDLQSLQLDNPALSFIEASASTVVTRPAAGRRSSAAKSAPKRSAKPISSAEDAARTKAQDSQTQSKTWYVQHKNAKGKLTVSKMSTGQILAGIKTEALGPKAKAKDSADGVFLPLAQYREFSTQVEKRVIKQKADSRSTNTQKMFAKLDRQDRRRKRWRWLRNLTQSVKGLISLVIYLAVIVGVLAAGVIFGWPYLRDMLNG